MSLASILATASTTTTTVAGKSKSGGSILDPIAKPIADFLAAIYAVIPNYGVAIIILSITWMLIISPLTLKSTRSMLAMQKLQPELKKLQAQHKDDRQAFAQAQMELFREHNVSPFGSCLPMLLPLPIFFALYRVITGLSHVPPKYVPVGSEMYNNIVKSGGQLYAFGIDLSKSAISAHSSFGSALPYWILLGLMAATSYYQSSQMMSRNPAAAANPQARLMKFLPLAFVLFCFRFPAGVVLYYTISNVCRIVQQDLMYRFDPKVKALVAREVIEVEEITKEIDDRKKPSGSGSTMTPAKPSAGDNGSGRPSFREMWGQARSQSGSAKNQGGNKGSPPKATPAKGSQPPKGAQAKGGQASTGQQSQKQQPKPAAQGGQKPPSGGKAQGKSSGGTTPNGSGSQPSNGSGSQGQSGNGSSDRKRRRR